MIHLYIFFQYIIYLLTGLSLYFALPRHTFGEVQRVLFPRYFTINACLSLITLLIFVKHHPIYTWDTELAIQVCIKLLLCLLYRIVIILFYIYNNIGIIISYVILYYDCKMLLKRKKKKTRTYIE